MKGWSFGWEMGNKMVPYFTTPKGVIIILTVINSCPYYDVGPTTAMTATVCEDEEDETTTSSRTISRKQ